MSGVSYDVLSQFAKLVNKDKKTNTETTVYGTIVEDSAGNKYVKLDGTDQLTPYSAMPSADSTAVAADKDDRVSVSIKNHTATVTGNMSSPATISRDVDRFKNLVVDEATISKLEAGNISVAELIAKDADIDNLIANKATITDLIAKKIDTDIVEANYVRTNTLETNVANIENLIADEATIKDLKAKNMTVNDLIADKADINFANIDFANVNKAVFGNFYAQSGIIEDYTSENGTVTGKLVAVSIDADNIKTGSLLAERIMLQGDDGLFYKLNVDAMGQAMAEALSDDEQEKLKQGIHGKSIIAESITADKIKVSDLVAFGANIAGFNIKRDDQTKIGSIYSGVKASADNSTRGIYMGDDGQFAVGDSNNFLKFFKDTDGNYKLAIQAQNITFGAGKKNVETAINDVQTNVDNLKIGGRNYLRNSEDEQFTPGISRSEFLKTTFDLAPFFNDNGLVEVTLSFDAYAPTAGNVQVYCQNGSGSRYSFTKLVNVTTNWKRYSVTFTPVGPNEDFVESYLAFYGTYDSGVIPHVRKLKLEIGNKATDWSPAPEDIDDSISNAQSVADAAQATANANAEDLTNYISTTNVALESMQGQIDGSITTWFYEVAPTISNPPASNWNTTDLKNIHLGDLYYDTITGYCYRWQVKDNTYSWQLVKDTDVTKALEDAATAKDTADAKRRVFTATPTPPYDRGDLWVQGSSGDIMRCKQTKTASQTYQASDWEKASKYTDDTVAANAQNTANNAQIVANNAQTNIDNLEIGARNLALNSGEETSNNDYMFKGYQLSSALIEGETYTATMRVTPAAGVTYYGLYLSSGYRIMGKFNVLGTEEQTVSLTFTAGYADDKTPEVRPSYANNVIYRFPNDNTVTENSTIHWYKVEKGNRATDWTPAPEDAEIQFGDVYTSVSNAQTTAENAQSVAESAQNSADNNAISIEYLNSVVQKIQDSLKTLVIDESGTTVLDQTGTGWKFNFSDLAGNLDKIDDDMISALEYKGYISFDKNNDDPSITIGASKTGLKLKLTATSIEFLDGSNKTLVDILSSDEDGDVGLTTDKINVVEELAHGDFVWKVRANGNFGLSWKG